MPSRKRHEEFDVYLSVKGILLPDGQYGTVHTFMDRGTQSFGPYHRDIDFYHGEDGIRSWINGKINIIGQNRATDWLRAGLGHLCLDYIDTTHSKRLSWEYIYNEAYKLMKKMNWHKSRFRSF